MVVYDSSEILIELATKVESIPTQAIFELWKDGVPNAGHGVARLLFDKNETFSFVVNGLQYNEYRNALARPFCAWQIGLVKDYKFDRCIKLNDALNTWLGILNNRTYATNSFYHVLNQSSDYGINWQDILNSGKKILEHAGEKMTTENFVVTRVTAVRTGESYLTTQLILNFLSQIEAKEQASDSVSTAVYNAFVKYVPSDLSGMYNRDINFFEGVANLFYSADNLGIFSSDIFNAIKKQTTVKNGNNNKTFSGKNVADWIPAYGHQYNTGQGPDNLVEEWNDGSCFLAGTSIMVLDHGHISSKNIESLREYDVVVSAGGSLSVHSDERPISEAPAGKKRVVFSFNDDEPFFTASHPFWTDDGWKSINPIAAMDESRVMKVSELRVGDYIYRSKDIGNNLTVTDNVNAPMKFCLDYEAVQIKKINSEVIDAPARVHGVHLREGVHSYHANSYLVGVTYPETTPKRIVEAIYSNVDTLERYQLCPKLNKFHSVFKDMIGSESLSALQKEFVASSETQRRLANPPRLIAESEVQKGIRGAMDKKKDNFPRTNTSKWNNLKLTMYLKDETNKAQLPEGYSVPSQIMVHASELHVSGVKCNHARITSQKLLWRRAVGDEYLEVGSITLKDHGCLGHGYLSLKSKSDKSELLQVQVYVELRQREFYERQGRFILRLLNEKDENNCRDTITSEILSMDKTVIGLGNSLVMSSKDPKLSINFEFGQINNELFRCGQVEIDSRFSKFSGSLYHFDQTKISCQGREEFIDFYTKDSYELNDQGNVKKQDNLIPFGKREFAVVVGAPKMYGTYILHIEDGLAFANGDVLPSFEFDGNQLAWAKSLPNGTRETGKFTFDSDICIHGKGGVTYVDEDGDEVVMQGELMASIKQYLKIDNTVWDYYVEIGYDTKGTLFSHLMDVWTGEKSGYDQDGNSSVTATRQDGKNVYMIQLSTVALLFGEKYIEGEGTLDPFGEFSTGFMYEGDEDAPPLYRGKKCDMTGYPNQLSRNAARSLESNLLLHPEAASRSQDHLEQIEESDFYISGESELSVELLLNMPPPDPNAIVQFSQDKIVAWSEYCMTDEQRELVGVNKPDLPAVEIEYITQKEILSFYQDVYVKAYIASAFSSADDFEEYWNLSLEEVSLKMKFFWAGDVTGTLGAHPEYTAINEEATVHAFRKVAGENMEQFMRTSDPYEWAQALFDRLTTPFMLAQLVLQYGENSTDQIMKYSNQLLCLDRSGDLSLELWTLLGWSSFSERLDAMGIDREEDILPFIRDAFEQIIILIINDAGTLFGDMRELAKEVALELELDWNMRAEDLARQMTLRMDSFITSLAIELGRNDGSSLPMRLSRTIQEYNTKYPRVMASIELGAQLVGLATLAYGMYVTFATLMDWENLNFEEKVLTVVNIFGSTAEGVLSMKSTIDDIRGLAKALRKPTASIPDAIRLEGSIKTNLKSPKVAKAVGNKADDIAIKTNAKVKDIKKPGLQNAAKHTAKNTATKGAAAQTAKISKKFNAAEKVANKLNIVMLAATSISLGFQVKRNFQNGEPLSILIIDTVNAVVTTTATVIAIGAAVLGTSVPVVGQVLVGIGAVLSLISSIIMKNKPEPKTPHQIWIEDEGNPFVAAIPKISVDFALNQLDLKPTPILPAGITEEAYIGNLLNIPMEKDQISSNGTFEVPAETEIPGYKANGTAFSLELKIGDLEELKMVYIISSVRLTQLEAKGAELWKDDWYTINQQNNLSSVKEETGFYFYRCPSESNNPAWSVKTGASSQYTINLGQQNLDVEHEPLFGESFGSL